MLNDEVVKCFYFAASFRVFTKRNNSTCPPRFVSHETEKLYPITVLTIACVIRGAPLALKATLTKMAAYSALTCTVVSIMT
jgi:hypothetical protein